MSFQLFFLADKYKCPLYFNTESNKIVKSIKNSIMLPDQYKFVVKFDFSLNSSIFINPYTGLLLSSAENETRKVLDDTTFFNSSIDTQYSFLPVESKNFRVLWSNDALVHIHSLDSKIMEKMNYNVKKGVFIHHSYQYIDTETNQIIKEDIQSLKEFQNLNIYDKKIIITLGWENSNISKFVKYVNSNLVYIINSSESLYYEINYKSYIQRYSSSAYYNNIGFLSFTNIFSLYTNTFIDIGKNMKSALETIENKMLEYCLQNGINCILHRLEELKLGEILSIKNMELYNKNIWFIWSEQNQRKEKFLTTFYDIDKLCIGIPIFNHSNWKNAALEIMDTHFELITAEKKFSFSLFYSDCNEIINPISRYSLIEEMILPEFILSILIQLYLNKDLSNVLSNELLDFQIEDIQNEKYKLLQL